LLAAAASAPAQLAVPPPPAARVNDYAGAMAPADRARLEQKLVDRERGTSTQVVVAIFPSLRGESLEDYSVRLAQAWRVGQKGLDNGVVFLIFVQDRKMRLEVGYGLEATLTDAIAASIIRDVVAPRFREGRLADGIEAGLDAIASAIAGTYARPPGVPGRVRDERNPLLLVGLILIVATGIPLLLTSLADARRARRHGVSGGRHGWGVADPDEVAWPRGGVFLPPPFPPPGREEPRSAPDTFRGGGGRFGGGGASGSW
jgi:uncharacterized protein